MKNLIKFSKITVAIIFTLYFKTTFAQKIKPTVTILNMDSKGIPNDAQQLGNVLRTEVEKLDTFDVTDKYDVNYLVEKNKLNVSNCYGKICLLELAKIIQTDYIITGGVELIGQNIIVTLRLIDIKKQSIEKTTIEEFNNLPLEVQSMVKITLRKMFNLANNEELLSRLTKKFDYENTLNNPNKNKINLEGPRFGYVFLFGPEQKVITAKEANGGYNLNPAFFQIGYQFEKQYLNEGNFQALFEFLPMITGLDQQLIVPNLAILNGFRNNKSGWEFAIGGTVSLVRKLEGAEYEGKFLSKKDILKIQPESNNSYETRLDSRGDLNLSTAMVVAFGKTFKSGRLNIPVNIWGTIPTKEGFRLGISFGYNSKL